jgi:hypothetical protein
MPKGPTKEELRKWRGGHFGGPRSKFATLSEQRKNLENSRRRGALRKYAAPMLDFDALVALVRECSICSVNFAELPKK